MQPIHWKLENDAQFGEAKPLGKPVGLPVAQARLALNKEVPQADIGFWECTVGRFEREIMQAEYSYFLKGVGRFTPVGGETIAFKAGDSIYFPANTHGVWEVDEPVCKTYVIFKDSAAE